MRLWLFSSSVRLRRLAWAFVGRLCDKYNNIMSWLICFFRSPNRPQGNHVIPLLFAHVLVYFNVLLQFQYNIPKWHSMLRGVEEININALFDWGTASIWRKVIEHKSYHHKIIFLNQTYVGGCCKGCLKGCSLMKRARSYLLYRFCRNNLLHNSLALEMREK